jgi:hypothetical protein
VVGGVSLIACLPTISVFLARFSYINGVSILSGCITGVSIYLEPDFSYIRGVMFGFLRDGIVCMSLYPDTIP